MKTQRQLNHIAFAGGGSGGHTYPLLAVAEEIRRENPQVKIYFVSTQGSVESRILERSGWKYYLIISGKLNSQSPLKILQTLIKLPIALLKSAWILLLHRPQFVLSAGGYAGAPFLVMAALLGVPCAIYEQNRKPGLANRWMARFSRFVFINFPDTSSQFTSRKTVTVGLPFRKEILQARWKESDWQEKLLQDPFRIFVFGGSQGAVAINRLMVEALPFLGNIKNKIFVHHQTGQNDLANVQQGYAQARFANCQVEPYIHDMTSAYKAAHLVICRAGASSIAELAAAGKATIFIPLASRDNHQEPNAQELVKQGASVLLVQKDASGEKLAAIIRDFFQNRNKVRSLAQKIGGMCLPDSERKILQEIKNYLNRDPHV